MTLLAKIFIKGANYIPQDVFLSRVKADDYKQIINAAKDAGINMLRVWGGGVYEKDIFYTLCDEAGIMVWQDFMFACSMYPLSQDFAENVTAEAKEQVRRLRKHPCIALWCGNNEIDVAWHNWGWQKEYNLSGKDSTKLWHDYVFLFERILKEVVRKYHPTSNYVPTSPLSNWGTPENFNHGSMHYWGVWHGEDAFEEFKNNVPRFMAEYGFQAFPPYKSIKKYCPSEELEISSETNNLHQKSYKGNRLITKHINQHYTPTNSLERYSYLSLLTQAKALKMAISQHRINKKCNGTIFWQFNDCWPGPSWSCIDYYGERKASYYTVKNMYKNQKLIADVFKDEFKLYFINEKMQDENLKALIIFHSISGASKKLKEIPINTRELSARECLITIPTKSLITDKAADFIEIQLLSEKNDVLDADFIYFTEEKNLKLPKAMFTYETENTENKIRIKIKAETFIKNLYFSGESPGYFTENYFDMPAGSEKEIYFISNEDISNISMTSMTLN